MLTPFEAKGQIGLIQAGFGCRESCFVTVASVSFWHICSTTNFIYTRPLQLIGFVRKATGAASMAAASAISSGVTAQMTAGITRTSCPATVSRQRNLWFSCILSWRRRLEE